MEPNMKSNTYLVELSLSMLQWQYNGKWLRNGICFTCFNETNGPSFSLLVTSFR